MVIGIILAGGKGTRFKAKNMNKNAVLFHNKPLIQYGIDAYANIVDKIAVVVGAYKDSVITAIKNPSGIIFVDQKKRLGTGHAVQLVVKSLKKENIQPSIALIGYGDHMSCYTEEMIEDIVKDHIINNSDVTVVTTVQKNPTGLGRIVRDRKGNIQKIVEEKDATPKERLITEINAGFYCFNYSILESYYKKLAKSPVTGEYYINEFISLAIAGNKTVKAFKVPFKYIGYGINTRDDFEHGLQFYASR